MDFDGTHKGDPIQQAALFYFILFGSKVSEISPRRHHSRPRLHGRG